jgi:tetratricopeptide (TPR) repeat protein
MKSLISLVLILGLTVPPAVFARQSKSSKPKPAASAAKTPANALDALVSQGKNADAVRLATRNPAIVLPFLKSRMDQIDLQITDRKIEEAKAAASAIEAFANAYRTASRRNDLPLSAIQGRVLRIEGISLANQKQYAKSEEVLEKALEVGKTSGDKALEAGIHNNLGYAMQFQQEAGSDIKLLSATEQYEMARQMAEEQKDSLRAASYNFNLGIVLLTTRKYESALSAFKRSTEQAREVSRPNYEARGVLYQGITLSKINLAAKEQLEYFSNAARLFEKLGDARNAGWSYWLMAEQTAYTGDYKDAARCAELAEPFLTKANDKVGLLQCYEFLMDMYTRFQDEESKAKKEKYEKLSEELRKQSQQ